MTGPGKVWTSSYNFGKYKATMGVTVTVDKNGNVKGVAGAPDAPDAVVDVVITEGAPTLSQMGIEKFVAPPTDKYEIFGEDMQILRFRLAPGEKVEAEPGAMVYMSDDVQAGCNMVQPLKRCMGGSPCCMGTFTAPDGEGAYVALTPNRPAKVIPLAIDPSKAIKAKDGAYLASTGAVEIDFELNSCANACCSGQGCCNQIIKGDGTAFLGAMGELMMKYVPAGETVVIDSGSVVAWEDTVTLSFKRAGGCCAMCCGGEGLTNTTLEGPGTVYIQSYSYDKFKRYAMGWVIANQGSLGAPAVAESASGAPPAADAIVRA